MNTQVEIDRLIEIAPKMVGEDMDAERIFRIVAETLEEYAKGDDLRIALSRLAGALGVKDEHCLLQ